MGYHLLISCSPCGAICIRRWIGFVVEEEINLYELGVLTNYMGILTNYCGKIIIFEKLILYFEFLI